MSMCLFGLAAVFFVIGIVIMVAPETGPSANSLSAARYRPPFVPVANNPLRSVSQPVARSAAPAAVSVSQPIGGVPMSSEPQKWNWIKVGQRIRVPHPVKGELIVHALGKITYAELWQQGRGAQIPWVPTGNQFAGYWLDQEMLLLNWQTRFYILDEHNEVSDTDIQRDFAPHAKKFAQSDQTGNVYFAYPPASWHIDDIGKFQVGAVEGAALNVRPGAIGRFVHASGDSNRALVLDDFESGGQDMVWTGYQLKEEDIRPE